MRHSKKNFTERTLAVWQPRTSRNLTPEDAREIIENMTGFVRILLEWDAAERRRSEGLGESRDGTPPATGGAL